MDRGLFGRREAAGVVVCGVLIAAGLSSVSSAGNGVDFPATAEPLRHDEAIKAWHDRVAASMFADRFNKDMKRGDGDGDGADSVPVLRVFASSDGNPLPPGNPVWPDAFETLEDALAAGALLDGPVQVWVAAGTYIPGGVAGSRSDAFVLFDGLELLGGFAGNEGSAEQRDPVANPTILSGNRGSALLNEDNNFHVIRFEGFFLSATIDGFTIREGNANGTGDDRFGGGLWVKNASLTVRNSLFLENRATKGGGGMHATGSSATIVVEDSVFVNNTGETGGGLCLANGGGVRNCSFLNNNGVFGGGLGAAGVLQLEGSLFENNFGIEGGGLSTQNGTLRMKWTRFTNNSAQRGAGVRMTGGNNHIISNCRFMLGTANEGGAIYTSGPCTIVNSLIAWNNAFAIAGGVYSNLASDATTNIVQSTVWQNTASQSGGGLYNSIGTMAVANSVVFKNSAFGASTPLNAQFFSSNFGTRTARYSCIEGIAAAGSPVLGPQNFGESPQFVDPLGADGIPGTGDENFTPGPGSPLLDRAEDDSIPFDALDLDLDGDTGERIPLDLIGNSRFIASPEIPSPLPQSGLRADIGAVEAPSGTDSCIGDINGDGIIDALDLSILLSLFGTMDAATVADLNFDGVVDSADLSILLSALGDPC